VKFLHLHTECPVANRQFDPAVLHRAVERSMIERSCILNENANASPILFEIP
jgi:hypothetical protein